jgi:hypothetical protein
VKVFEYAVLRATPRVDRGESINIGILLYCQADDLLTVRVHVDALRLRALDGDVDLDGVVQAAAALERTCAGEGPAGDTTLGQRFRWLTAPRSTVVSTGPVHSALAADPSGEADRLLELLVR